MSTILNNLLNTEERKAKTTKNEMLNLFTKVEQKIYNKTKKLIYEIDSTLDYDCMIAGDANDENAMLAVIKRLKALEKGGK
jgi:hypothetical protein